jgi:hypothetical protein
MRQYAIKSEFELAIESSSPIKYRGYCKGGDCPWSIHARPKMKGSPTINVSHITSQFSLYVIPCNFIIAYVIPFFLLAGDS